MLGELCGHVLQSIEGNEEILPRESVVQGLGGGYGFRVMPGFKVPPAPRGGMCPQENSLVYLRLEGRTHKLVSLAVHLDFIVGETK